MANPDLKGGFKFVRRLDGGTGAPQLMNYPLATTNEPLAKGDLVSLLAAGSVDRTCTDGGAVHGETCCIGVVDSILYKDSGGRLHDSTYVAAAQGDDTFTLGNGTGAIVRVISGVGNVFSVQCDSGGATAISQALVGTACNPLALEATDPTSLGVSGISQMELDTSDAGTDAGLFHIIDLDRQVGMVFSSTEADSRYGRVLVTFSEHLFSQVPTIAGI
jgi:hypothetical protein